MALIMASGTLANAAVPFDALSPTARISGTTTHCVLDLGPGTSLVVLTGTGLTYDAQVLPSGGTIASIQLFRSVQDLVWTASGLAVSAAEFRANAGDLDAFLFGGADTLVGGSTFDHLFGYGGADSIAAGAGDDGIVAGDGNDTVSTGTGTDGIDLGAGDDLLNIGDALNGGTKYADGGAGIDTIRAGGDISASVLQGFEVLAWQSPGDPVRLTGAQLAGFTTLHLGSLSPIGEATALEVAGGGLIDLGALTLMGIGADVLEVALVGATGAMLRGRDTGDGAPDDHVDAMGSGDDSIATFGGNDRVVSTGGNDRIWTGTGSDVVTIIEGNPFVVLDAGNDRGTGGTGRDTLLGGIGLDTLLGNAGDDLLVGEGGGDWIDAGDDADRVFGDDGNDTILGGSGNDTLHGGAGDDSIDGGGGGGQIDQRDAAFGNAGDDWIRIGNGLNLVHAEGGDGADTIVSSGLASTLLGGEGDDVLTGSAFATNPGFGTDIIDGGAGNDRIVGARGADTLTGGTGADTFAYANGDGGSQTVGGLTQTDVILDFSRLEGDRIDLSAVDADTGVAGDQAFRTLALFGTGDPIGAGSLVYAFESGGTAIFGSTDADATFEFRILVGPVGYVPTLEDFIL